MRKVMTLRDYSSPTRALFEAAHLASRPVRVWRGQGHAATVGVVVITHMGWLTINQLTPMHLSLEGWPDLTRESFYQRFFVRPCGAPGTKKYAKQGPPPTRSTPLTYIMFNYYPLYSPVQTVIEHRRSVALPDLPLAAALDEAKDLPSLLQGLRVGPAL